MEIFVDFGLFELLAAAALIRLGRALYSKRAPAGIVLFASVGAPVCLLFLVEEGATKWLAVVVLATAILNASLALDSVRALRRAGPPHKSP